MWELDHKEGWALKNWWSQIVLEKTLESPWDCKEIKTANPKGNQHLIFTGRLMLKLIHQHFGHPMQRADSLEKTLMLGKIEGKRRKWWQRMRWLDNITDSMDVNLSKDSGAWCAAVHGVEQSWTQLNNWTTTRIIYRLTNLLANQVLQKVCKFNYFNVLRASQFR